MRSTFKLRAVFLVFAALVSGPTWADNYSETIEMFRDAIRSDFFNGAYGFAVFPNIGKGGMGIGGAHGKGQVYKQGAHVGDTRMTQVTVGFQLGGQVYSQIILFKDEKSFKDFTSGNFEFGAQATAIAITASASAATTIHMNRVGPSHGCSNAVSSITSRRRYDRCCPSRTPSIQQAARNRRQTVCRCASRTTCNWWTRPGD